MVTRIKQKLNRKFWKVLIGVPFSSVAETVAKSPIYEAAVGTYREEWERPLPQRKCWNRPWDGSKPREETGERQRPKPVVQTQNKQPAQNPQQMKGHENRGQKQGNPRSGKTNGQTLVIQREGLIRKILGERKRVTHLLELQGE